MGGGRSLERRGWSAIAGKRCYIALRRGGSARGAEGFTGTGDSLDARESW